MCVGGHVHCVNIPCTLSSPQVAPVVNFPDPAVNTASQELVQAHASAFVNERIIMQVRGLGGAGGGGGGGGWSGQGGWSQCCVVCCVPSMLGSSSHLYICMTPA